MKATHVTPTAQGIARQTILSPDQAQGCLDACRDHSIGEPLATQLVVAYADLASRAPVPGFRAMLKIMGLADPTP